MYRWKSLLSPSPSSSPVTAPLPSQGTPYTPFTPLCPPPCDSVLTLLCYSPPLTYTSSVTGTRTPTPCPGTLLSSPAGRTESATRVRREKSEDTRSYLRASPTSTRLPSVPSVSRKVSITFDKNSVDTSLLNMGLPDCRRTNIVTRPTPTLLLLGRSKDGVGFDRGRKDVGVTPGRSGDASGYRRNPETSGSHRKPPLTSSPKQGPGLNSQGHGTESPGRLPGVPGTRDGVSGGTPRGTGRSLRSDSR